MIEIWEPKYSTQSVLVAAYKLKPGVNQIIFTKANHLQGAIFEITQDEAVKYPMRSNGKIKCYDIPLDKFKRVK